MSSLTMTPETSEIPSCPACRLPMDQSRHKGVPLWGCRDCRGFWFEPGQLAEVEGIDHDLPQTSDVAPNVGRACPRCPVDLDERPYIEGEPLMIDYCPMCHGIFFDRGEYKALVRLRERRDEGEETGMSATAAELHRRRNRVLRSKRPAWDVFHAIWGFALGFLFTRSIIGALGVAAITGFIGDRFYTEFGFLRMKGPWWSWPWRPGRSTDGWPIRRSKRRG